MGTPPAYAYTCIHAHIQPYSVMRLHHLHRKIIVRSCIHHVYRKYNREVIESVTMRLYITFIENVIARLYIMFIENDSFFNRAVIYHVYGKVNAGKLRA